MENEGQKVKWMGAQPIHCEFCLTKFKKDGFFYDMRIGPGLPWGLACESCFHQQGGELGVGKAQKYSVRTLMKVAG
jgi:hypothetical protein